MLHVVFGDSAAGTLRHALPGAEVVAWPDPLSCGPVADAEDLEVWLQRRRHYWLKELEVDLGGLEHPRFLKALQSTPHVVLWAGTMADEQLLAAWTVTLLRKHHANCSIDIVPIDPHPDFSGFSALGHQSPKAAAALANRSRPLSPNEQNHCVRAWSAWSHTDPSLLLAFIADPSAPKRLVAALDALRGRYPDPVHGLSLWEHRFLHHLSLHQPNAVLAMGHTLAEMLDTGPYAVGDSWLYARMRHHAAPRVARPLLSFELDSPHLSGQRATLTPDGLAVLAGTANATSLNGCSDTIGGVTLNHPNGPLWLRTADGLVPHKANATSDSPDTSHSDPTSP